MSRILIGERSGHFIQMQTKQRPTTIPLPFLGICRWLERSGRARHLVMEKLTPQITKGGMRVLCGLQEAPVIQ